MSKVQNKTRFLTCINNPVGTTALCYRSLVQDDSPFMYKETQAQQARAPQLADGRAMIQTQVALTPSSCFFRCSMPSRLSP